MTGVWRVYVYSGNLALPSKTMQEINCFNSGKKPESNAEGNDAIFD